MHVLEGSYDVVEAGTKLAGPIGYEEWTNSLLSPPPLSRPPSEFLSFCLAAM